MSKGEMVAVLLATMAAVASTVAAGAAVWQAADFHASLRDPYTANLQARQTDACAEFLYRASDFRTSFELWASIGRNELPFADDIQLTEADMLPIAREGAMAVGPPLERLSFLSSKETSDLLKSVSSAMSVFVLQLNAARPFTKAQEQPWLRQYDTNFAKISGRCRRAMLGEQVGLL